MDSEGRVRSSSKLPRDQSGVRDVEVRNIDHSFLDLWHFLFLFQTRVRVKTLAKKAQKKMNLSARKGEADRKIVSLKPRHLLSGKRGIGKAGRR